MLQNIDNFLELPEPQNPEPLGDNERNGVWAYWVSLWS